MLRASSDATGQGYQLEAITRGKGAGDGGIPHGALLVELADAAVALDEAALEPLRRRVVEAMGEEALVDACGVIANFQRMVRIADGTGIPLDDFMMAASSDLRGDLGVARFAGAHHSRRSWPRRVFERLTQPMMRRLLLERAAGEPARGSEPAP